MKIDNLQKQFHYLSATEIEKLIVQAIQKGFVNCRIDYRNNIIKFIPSLESENIRFNLAHIHQNFQKLIKNLYPESKTQQMEQQKKIIDQISINIEKERNKIIERRKLIEKIKEFREEEEKAHKEQEQKKEKIRLEEIRKNDAERRRRIHEEQQIIQAEKEEKLKSQQKAQNLITILHSKNIEVDPDPLRLNEVDPEAFVKQQLKRLVSEKKKKEMQIKTLCSKMDHQIRATRELEIPHIKEAWENKVKNDEDLFLEQKHKYLENHRKKMGQRNLIKEYLIKDGTW